MSGPGESTARVRAWLDALAPHVRDLEVSVSDASGGLAVALTLQGALPADARERIRRAFSALIDAPIGELSGAVQWLTDERVSYRETPGSLVVSVTVPLRTASCCAYPG